MPDPADDFLRTIGDLLRTRKYEWARPTLDGIRRRVQETGSVTMRMQEAVEHVILGRLKHDIRWE